MHYGEEQAQQLLQAQELLDLRHAIQASMESDDDDEWGEESPEEPPPPPLPEGEEEGDEKEEIEEEWSTETSDINVPSFHAPTGKQHGAV